VCVWVGVGGGDLLQWRVRCRLYLLGVACCYTDLQYLGVTPYSAKTLYAMVEDVGEATHRTGA